MAKVLIIDLMYRDGANYKTSEEQHFLNDTGITADKLMELLQENHLFNEGIMVQDYGIDSIAPLDNEFLPVPDGSEDHSFTEIRWVSEDEYEPKEELTPISKVIELIHLGGDKEAEYKRRVYAMSIAKTLLFPNGFTSWYETHHEVVSAVNEALSRDSAMPLGLKELYDNQGTGGMYELAKTLTDEFEELHRGREWDGEFFDEMEDFISNKLYNL